MLSLLALSRRVFPTCRLQSSRNLHLFYRSHTAVSRTPGYLARPARFESRRNYADFRDRNVVGVFTPTSAAIFVVTGIGLLFYFRYEKARLVEQQEKDRESKKYGRPQVGGPFNLSTTSGEPYTEKNLLGKWSLVYFGFTNCPDICPAELDKMTAVLNTVEKDYGAIFAPIFISVDPARDTPSRIGQYLQDFHPSFTGLVGDYASTKRACKAYRVYFSTPPNADPNGDYLVDHSIYVYLMDPNGQFLEAFGQSVTVDEVVGQIREEVEAWAKEHGKTV